MHIKHIHDMIEKLSECAKVQMDKGIENIDAKEMGEVAEIIKELAEAEYYAKISKAMDEAEYGEDYDYMGAYEDHDRKGYRGQPRSESGRFMSRGDGRRSNRGRNGRRGYESPMMMYDEDWEEMERMRDMDRPMGRMYYQGGNTSSGMTSGSTSGMSTSGNQGSSQGGSRGYSEDRDYREGRSGRSRRGYMESKEMNKGNSPEEKKAKMAELEKYMTELGTDVTEMISDASQEEKNLLKQKMQTLIQKIQ